VRETAKFCDECGHELSAAPVVGAGAATARAGAVDVAGRPPRAPAGYTPKHLADKILTSRSALEGERKQVTVLFADCVGFTALSTRLDPEDLHTIMDGCFQRVLDAVDALLEQHPPKDTDVVEFLGAQYYAGLAWVHYDEGFGGLGLPAKFQKVINERLHAAGAPNAMRRNPIGHGMSAPTIYTHGSDDQKRRYLPRLARGEWLGCYCLTEPAAGSDAMSLATRAEWQNGEWILNGRKLFVTNGAEADLCIVYARSEATSGARGLSAFIVEKTFPGIQVGKVEKKLGIKCSSTAEILLDDCGVPASNLLGQRGEGGVIALSTLDGGRIGIAAQAVGIARACLEECAAYAAQRQQFGRPIRTFQAIQWAVADMATRIEASRLLMYRAAWLRDRGERCTAEAAVAKLIASETAMWAAHRAVQVFGGYGYIQDYPLERYFRDAKITEIYEGTSEILRLVIARGVLGSKGT
jgi:alkylation response protein AidB-like acyl-CoA dehydrogenase